MEQTTKTGTTGVTGIVFTYTLAVCHTVLSTTLDNMDVSNTRRIIILGKTGTGKSSLANTIFEEKLFKTSSTLNSETKECQTNTRFVNGRRITLIDTPGFFDTDRSEDDLRCEILRCITLCAPGPHAFLIVLKVERFTEHEQAVITEIRRYFSDEALKYATVLFTHGDQLPEGQTIMDLVRQNQPMSDLVRMCGGRCHVIDNRYWNNNQQGAYRSNQFQVAALLNTIDTMIMVNNGSCYTNEMLQAVEEIIQRQERLIRQSAGNMSAVQVREQATVSTFQGLLIKLASTTTGALLGAFFGLGLNVVGAMAGIPCNPDAIRVVAMGTMQGAYKGYQAAEGANTLWEAVQKAIEAVKDA